MPNSIDNQDSRGRTQLHNAVINNDEPKIQQLLNSNPRPDVNIRDNTGRNGFTPMWYAACQTHNAKVVTALGRLGGEADDQIKMEVLRQATANPHDVQLKEVRTVLGLSRTTLPL